MASEQRRAVESQEAETRFVPIDVDDEDRAGAIAIELAPDLRVTVERNFDEEHLMRVLSVLAQC